MKTKTIIFLLLLATPCFGQGFFWQTKDGDKIPVETLQEVIETGNCVDEAHSILGILNRRYTAYDRLEVAVSPGHVQVVLNDLDEKKFLELEHNRMVVIGKWTGTDEVEFYMPTDKFLEAIEYYRPEVTKDEFFKFKGELNAPR